MAEHYAPGSCESNDRTDPDRQFGPLTVENRHQNSGENRRNGGKQRYISSRGKPQCVILGNEVERTGTYSRNRQRKLVAPAMRPDVPPGETKQNEIRGGEAVYIDFNRSHSPTLHQHLRTEERGSPRSHCDQCRQMGKNNYIFALRCVSEFHDLRYYISAGKSTGTRYCIGAGRTKDFTLQNYQK